MNRKWIQNKISLNNILKECARKFRNEPKLSNQNIEYQKSVEIIRKMGYLTLDQLKDFENQMYHIYCYTYGDPIEKEMFQNLKKNNSISSHKRKKSLYKSLRK